MNKIPLIGTGNLKRDSLAGQVAVVTGAGGGIGLEAARALAWLGARVVVAEINGKTGREAAARIAAEMGEGTAICVQTDVGDERSVTRLARRIRKAFGQVDIVLNNATIAPLGAVKDRPIADWDRSYRVNLRGPVLLARAFLPGMLTRDRGAFVCVASSPGPYMGPYEVLKTAQVELANTIAAELEGTGVSAFTIGPGIVRTATFEAAIPQTHLVSVEAAGAGFAAAIALAPKFHGNLLSSKPALVAAGIEVPDEADEAKPLELTAEERARALAACRKVRSTLKEQSSGWRERPIFERQWTIRDFRKVAGMPVEDWLDALEKLEEALASQGAAVAMQPRAPLGSLSGYYNHLAELAAGYYRDPTQRDKYVGIVRGWQREVEELVESLRQ